MKIRDFSKIPIHEHPNYDCLIGHTISYFVESTSYNNCIDCFSASTENLY